MPTPRQIEIERVFSRYLADHLYECSQEKTYEDVAKLCGCTPQEVHDAAVAVMDCDPSAPADDLYNGDHSFG